MSKLRWLSCGSYILRSELDTSTDVTNPLLQVHSDIKSHDQEDDEHSRPNLRLSPYDIIICSL